MLNTRLLPGLLKGMLIASLLLTGCSKRTPAGDPGASLTATPDPEEERRVAASEAERRMAEARATFAEEDWYGVTLDVREFVKLHPGSRFLDEAWFLLARAEYEQGNFLEAEDRFRKIIRDFPQSEFAEESTYYLGLALLSQSRGAELDQTETEAAQVQLRSFMNRYPESPLVPRAQEHIRNIREKLAEKSFKNGETYRKIKIWSAAGFYYEQVYRDFPNTLWAPRAGVRLAEVARKRQPRDWTEVAKWAARVMADFPDSPSAGAAQQLLDEATRELDLEEQRAFSTPEPTSGDDPR